MNDDEDDDGGVARVRLILVTLLLLGLLVVVVTVVLPLFIIDERDLVARTVRVHTWLHFGETRLALSSGAIAGAGASQASLPFVLYGN